MPDIPSTRPHLLLLHSHDTGRHIQPYGHGVRSPNLQGLAQEGVLFRRAFCAAPTCSPSRAALHTGQSAHGSGMIGLAHRGFRLAHPARTLATTLRDAGYRTVLAGVQHITGDHPSSIGYTDVADGAHERTGATVDATIAAIRDAAAAPAQPVFIDAGFFETHRDFPDIAPGAGRWLAPPAGLPDTPRVRADVAGFQASLDILDAAYGSILDALDAAGLAESTLVIATTDHGIAFPGHKCQLTDSGAGVLLIARGPGGFTGGRVLDALVSHLDLYPTLCELAGIHRPAWLEGRSLLPLVRGETDTIRDELFAEVTYHAAYEPQRLIRTDRHALIRRFDDRRLPVLPNIDDGPSRDDWLDAGGADRPIDAIRLYDTRLDPQQNVNLADDPGHAAVRDDLLARLDAWMTATDDLLLRGDVPVPPGARVNAPDNRSACEADLWQTDDHGTLHPVPNPRTMR